MADEDDYGGMEDHDFEWLYVEDDYPLSDELAETQIPDPGYAGTNFEIYQDHDDLDWLGYWDDREYIDDEYWDSAQLGALASKPTAKRKREEMVKESPGAKRRRVVMESMENVKYVSMAKRLENYFQPPPRLGAVEAFALLPDWQTRFVDETGVIKKKAMPEAMKKAAEAQNEDAPPKKSRHDALVEDGDDDECMDEDEVEDEDGEGDMAAQLASLDPEVLYAVLKQKLGDAGSDVNEDAIKQTLSKVLAGGDGADDAIGDLASVLLGRATQGNDSALSGWLSQQGVSLDAVEDEDDASSIATVELPSGVSEATKANVQVSPPDSAIEMSKQKSESKQIAIHGSSPSGSARKRPAPADDEIEDASKRKKVAFDVPPTSESTYLTADESVQGDERSNIATAHETNKHTDPETSEDRLMSEPTLRSTTSKPATSSDKTKAANEKAVKSNKSTSETSAEAKNYAKPTAAASAKHTRKRKAEVEADDDEIVVTAPKQKGPARKAAKTEPPARRTRSAKAKAGQ